MVKPPKTWEYTLIELEIDGKVVDSRIAGLGTFDKYYAFLLREGQTQRFPWAIFLSRYEDKNKIVTNKPAVYEDERP